jgi:hypothetical protein
MTSEEYLKKSNMLRQEMDRIRDILDRHAKHKDCGVSSDDAPLITKTLKEQTDVLERIKKLEKEFWGQYE